MNKTRGSHGMWDLTYHIIFVTKYRRQVLTGEVRDTVIREVKRLIESMDGKTIELECDADHIHILAELTPLRTLSEQINILKGVTARIARRDHMDLIKGILCGDSFWADSYYMATAGGATIEQLKQYVESQPTEEHKRKYVRSGKYVKRKHPASLT